MLGASIASVGHTDDTTRMEIVIGNNVLVAPANMIRHDAARRHGETQKLDLYALWPEMGGYTDAQRDAFNHRSGSRRLLFISIEPRQMSRDMSGRLEPIYRRLIELPGAPAVGKLRQYSFSEGSGYVDETLLVGERPGRAPFVARCLTGPAASESIAACERDIHVGDMLSLTYRFPSEMLADWATLDTAIGALAARLLRS